tara:strand:- start:202 stop:1086 length:885 start_codon:yes stop_codon:yes gene_type:complete
MNKLLSFIFIFFSTFISAQNISQKVIQEYEDTLRILANKIIYGKTFEIRKNSNIGFISEIKEVIKFKESYHYPFDSLETISKLSPEDKSFRLFNWILPEKNGKNRYFAIILLPSSSEDNYNQIIELKYQESNLFNFEHQNYNHENWYGALYYKIISPKKKNNKHYTLLGWDGNHQESIVKIIDVIEIDDNKINFGKDIFLKKKEISKRIAIEYNRNINVSVNFDSEKNRIILDHLVPLKKNQEGFNQFYVPDGSYDCFSYINGKWVFKEDIDVKIKKSLPKIKNNKNNSNLFKK